MPDTGSLSSLTCGLTAGDLVTAERMRALFGFGLHPFAELRQQQLEAVRMSIECRSD